MLQRLERFFERLIRSPVDELIFVIGAILAMMGLGLLGNFVAGRIGMFVAAGLGLPIIGFSGMAVRRVAQQWSEQEIQRRMSRDFLIFGALCLAIYALGLFGSKYYPVLDPVDGELWIGFSLIFAAAPGSLFIGAAGLYDERICFAVSERTRKLPLPLWTRFVGWTLLLTGFAIGGYLVFLLRSLD